MAGNVLLLPFLKEPMSLPLFIRCHYLSVWSNKDLPGLPPTLSITFFPLFLLSLIYFQFSQKQAHTKFHANALLQVHTNKSCPSADVSPPVHSAPSQGHWRSTQSILSLRLSSLSPTTARANCICKFGICVPLPLHPSLHSQVKGSFGCSLSIKSKKGHKVHETKGSNSQLSCNA